MDNEFKPIAEPREIREIIMNDLANASVVFKNANKGKATITATIGACTQSYHLHGKSKRDITVITEGESNNTSLPSFIWAESQWERVFTKKFQARYYGKLIEMTGIPASIMPRNWCVTK